MSTVNFPSILKLSLPPFCSIPQRLDRSLTGSYSYSPYSMNYQSDNSFQGSNQSSSSYIQSTYSPQFHHQMYSHNVAAVSSPQHFNHHNHSPSSTSTATKTSSIRYGSNSELSKRTRNQSYELSQDLQDKQIELLERKYGGSVRAQRAALVIQRALRRYMLNRKFASIRANVKIDRRSSNTHRMSTSQSMDMNHRNRSVYDASPLATPMRSPIMKTLQHPYVNLLHQQQHFPPYQLQYQNQSTPEMNQSWSHQNTPPPAPLVQHYTAAQIYMRPKPVVSQQSSPSLVSKKPPPPEVPKRLSSSISTGSQSSLKKSNGLSRSSEWKFCLEWKGVSLWFLKPSRSFPVENFLNFSSLSANNGSLQSVQSSGSESSVSIEKLHYENFSDRGTSPLWKRKDVDNEEETNHALTKKNIATENFKISEIIRKRKYRIGLNLFNKKPDKGVEFLVKNGKKNLKALSSTDFNSLRKLVGFLENTATGVAKFLITRKGLSRQMIGEYLGLIQQPFNMSVLDAFCEEIDLSGNAVDVALRKFQSFFRMPGEAQKIERLMQAFSQRYSKCNPEVMSKLKSSETVSWNRNPSFKILTHLTFNFL